MNEKQTLRIRVADLEAENKLLKNQIIDIHALHNAIDKRAEKAEQKIEQLEEALKKCSPLNCKKL